jgi:hypothetical protein
MYILDRLYQKLFLRKLDNYYSFMIHKIKKIITYKRQALCQFLILACLFYGNSQVYAQITVSNIPAAATVQCASNIPTLSPTFTTSCPPITSVQQYNTYLNCTNPNIQSNNGFETVGSATFSSTFQGYPAQQLPNGSTLLSGWEMGFGDCAGTCAPGQWIYDYNNTINNPEGSRFLYLGGLSGGYCAVSRSPMTLSTNECAELCFNGASWATSGAQTPVRLDIEYFLNGNDAVFTYVTTIYLPPSTSFQNLNWQDICFNFSAPTAGTYNFVFTLITTENTNPAAGMAIDNIRIKKCCTTNPDPTSCNYTFTKYWLATDACGKQAIASQKVTVADTQAPILSGVPANATVCTTPPSPPTVTANDNCEGAVTPVYVQTSTQTSNGSCTDNNYTITRRWTATDRCSNVVIGTQIITVVTPSVSVAGATVCTGGTATLTAVVGCSLVGAYQWQLWNGTTWMNTGTNSSTFNTGVLSASTQYRVIFTTTLGSCAVTAAPATVTLTAGPTVSVSLPPANVCVGANVTLTATPSVGAVCTIQWQSSPNGTTWTNITGATGATYIATNLNTTTRYRAQLIACSGGCCN